MLTEYRMIRVVRDRTSDAAGFAGTSFSLSAAQDCMLSRWLETLADELPHIPRTVWSVHEGNAGGPAAAYFLFDDTGRYLVRLTVPDVQMRLFTHSLVYCRYFYSTNLRVTVGETERSIKNKIRLELPFSFSSVQTYVLRLFGHYDRFSTVTANLEWEHTVLRVFDLPSKASAFCVMNLVRFSGKYHRPEDEIVQALLMKLASQEHMPPDFFPIDTFSRAKMMREQKALYERCISFPFMRLMPLSANSMLRLLYRYLPEDAVIPAQARDVIWNGVCYELGGYSPDDHALLCVDKHTVLLTDCGIRR